MITLSNTFTRWPLQGKRVLVRIDANVPLSNGTILNDYRLQAILPTLHHLKKSNAKIILATHLGRPASAEPALSTKQLIPWFEKQEFVIDFVENIAHTIAQSSENPDHIVLLENLRFFPGEKGQDLSFAQQLARCAEYYINDAFGALHRSDTSLTLLAQQFDANHRSIGLLIERELKMLNTLLDQPAKPFVLLLGGGKVADKIPLIQHLLPLVDTILLGPAISNTFLAAQGKKLGISIIERDLLPLVKELCSHAQTANIPIYLPEDFLVGPTIKGPYSIAALENFPDTAMAIGIGPKTIARYSAALRKSKTIFYNGLMGTLASPETLLPIKELFMAMTDHHATTIIAGGDSVGAAQKLGFSDAFTYLSTGGGATLTYLSGKNLPGLAVFIQEPLA